MTFRKLFELECDLCGKVLPFIQLPTLTLVRKEARETFGWVHRGNSDICGSCKNLYTADGHFKG